MFLPKGSPGGTLADVIARKTHLSSGTVRNHLAAAVAKPGAATRSEAYVTAHDDGWL